MNIEQEDVVKHPNHYKLFGIESKHIIETILDQYSQDMSPYQIWCFGSSLKYRLRTGKKSHTLEDVHKALEFEEMYGKVSKK